MSPCVLSLTRQPQFGARYHDTPVHVDSQADWSPRQTAPHLPVLHAPATIKHQTLADAVTFSASPNEPSAVPSFPSWRRDSFVASDQSYASPPSGGSRRHSSPGASSATSPGALAAARHSRVSSFDSAAGPPSPDEETAPVGPDGPAPPLLQIPPSSGKVRPIPKRKPGGSRTLTEGDRRAICLYARDHPEEKQQAMAVYFGVDRTTISKTLKACLRPVTTLTLQNREKWIAEVPVNSRSPLAEAARKRPLGGDKAAHGAMPPLAPVVPAPPYLPPATTAFYSPTMPAPATFGPRGSLDALASAAVHFSTPPPPAGVHIQPRADNAIAQPTPFPMFASEMATSPTSPRDTSASAQYIAVQRSRSNVDRPPPAPVELAHPYGSAVGYLSAAQRTPSIVQPVPTPLYVTPPARAVSVSESTPRAFGMSQSTPRASDNVDAAVDVLARFLKRPLAGGDEHSRSIGLRIRELAAIVSSQQNGLGFSV